MYKVVTCKVKEAEGIMNQYYQQGYKVLTVTPNNGIGFGVVITFAKI